MQISAILQLIFMACVATACASAPVGVERAAALSRQWMFGVERMRDDPEPRLAYTNRLIADIAPMPKVQVVFLNAARDDLQFAAWAGPKLRVAPWLHGEGNCMNINYTLFEAGQRQALLALIVSSLPAGVEPNSSCVDRAADQFYKALVIQGL